MKVPLLDLAAQHTPIREELRAALERVLDSQQFVNGPQIAELEAAVAAYCGCARGIAVSSGTDALLCALMVLGIGPGDEVITVPYTFFATAGCISRTGARPVFVDIEPNTFNMDVRRLEKAVTPRTKAIMPVHLFGQCADMDAIHEVAHRHSLYVIEDAAQAIGAKYKGRPAGSMSTFGCLSFFPSKNLGGLGDGGMILTQDSDRADLCQVYRNHGMRPRYYHHHVGANFRLDTFQAATLLVKLKHLDEYARRRRENARLYGELFAGCDALVTPKEAPGNFSVCNQYCIRVRSRRDELQKHLEQNGIGTAVYYPVSLHQQACFRDLGYRHGDFPESERAAEESLALPIYPELKPAQIEYVAGKVKAFLRA